MTHAKLLALVTLAGCLDATNPDAELVVRRIATDETGTTHVRYARQIGGLDVVAGDVIAKADGVVPEVASVEATTAELDVDTAGAIVLADPRFVDRAITAAREVYVQTPAALHHAFEIAAQSTEDEASDKVYVDALDGEIVAVHPQIAYARDRRLYSAEHGWSLPGTLIASEGFTSGIKYDLEGQAAFANAGAFYDAFASFFGRDSYDNAGAQIKATIRYGSNYCNAYWNGSQVVLGSGSACGSFAQAPDVVAHELSHGIVTSESGLVLSGESGAIAESLADIFGAFVEAYLDGGKTGTLRTSSGTWLIGEDLESGAVRDLCHPTADGGYDWYASSLDWSSLHRGAGIGNVAFCVLARGSTAAGRGGVPVTGIGMEKAVRLFYWALQYQLTPNATYSDLRAATVRAAEALGYSTAERQSIRDAWRSVNVGVVALTSTVSLATQEQRVFDFYAYAGDQFVITTTGTSGDADLYVKYGSQPTLTSWDYRSYGSTSNETITIANAWQGRYYILLHGYSAATNVKLTVRRY
jgi:vibriolysin